MNQRISEAFQAVPRKHFVLPKDVGRVNEDGPLSIGYGQTISQPTTVRRMLEWLDAQPGERILDVGSGSGWTSALLSYLTGPNGHVTAVERILKLVEFGRNNCHKIDCKNVSFHQAGQAYGWPDDAPYDRILVSASADRLPIELVEQLAPNGKLVIPIGNTIHEIIKRADGQISDIPHPGYIFVPLLPSDG
jgi:protein-L-isoaspartate(D-aspartate) O-methyltransferase